MGRRRSRVVWWLLSAEWLSASISLSMFELWGLGFAFQPWFPFSFFIFTKQNSLKLTNLLSRYKPEVGDIIVGRVIEVEATLSFVGFVCYNLSCICYCTVSICIKMPKLFYFPFLLSLKMLTLIKLKLICYFVCSIFGLSRTNLGGFSCFTERHFRLVNLIRTKLNMYFFFSLTTSWLCLLLRLPQNGGDWRLTLAKMQCWCFLQWTCLMASRYFASLLLLVPSFSI